MATCEHCRPRLLDYVYDLLDGNDRKEMRDHLHVCAECQAELARVQCDQVLLARAAKAVTEIPEFALPTGEPASLPQQPTAPATLPFADAPQRSFWRRRAVVWSAAAAVLLAVSASISAYRVKVHNYQNDLTAKRDEHRVIAERFAALPASCEKTHEAAVHDLRVTTAPYLHVVGPTTMQPGAKAHLHITSHHVEGTPRVVKDEFARSNLRVKLMEATSGKVLDVLPLKCDDDGHAVAELDASGAKANSQLTVCVEADIGLGVTRLAEKIQLQAPTYVTRIDTNKTAYQLKDVLFFRVLVLDRYSLQPPTKPLPLRVDLINPAGKSERSLVLMTGAGGMLAKEFAIEEHFLAGNYTLQVQPADATKAPVQSAVLPLEIVRELREPDIVLDQNSYVPGETASGTYHGATAIPQRALIDNIPVPFTTSPAPVAPKFGGGIPGAKGKSPAMAGATRFSIPIPATVPGSRRAELTLEMKDGTKKNATLPLGATQFDIDFFPEGGDLIAGVQNRVFYRVRSKSGEPVTGNGNVILETSRQNGKTVEVVEIIDSTYQLGMGYLDFTPRPKESYSVRITTPGKVQNVANPFARLGIKAEGVVVHVPKAVGKQGEPILITLRQQGPTRKLLLLAQCRGQIVDQRWVEVKKGAVDLTLQPTPEANGMIRVTAYERQDEAVPRDLDGAVLGFARPAAHGLQGDVLAPVAERLVYRSATQRLDLHVETNASQLLPGQDITAKLRARDEKGQPVPAWILASVVDERFQGRPRSLSAHFFLLNEVRTGPDLDNAQLIVHDAPESVQMLERFLGTHGWRRFVHSQEPGIGLAKRAAQPQVFSRANQPLDVLQRNYESAMAKALDPIRGAGFLEESELEIQRTQSAVAVLSAAQALHDFEEGVQLWIRITMGMIVALLLAVSLILMALGTYRILRAHKLATPAFGAAFGCLAACLALVFLNSALGPIDVPIPAAITARGPAKHEVHQRLADQFAQLPTPRLRVGRPYTGAFELQMPQPADRQEGKDFAVVAKQLDELRKDQALALRENLARVMVEREQGEAKVFAVMRPQAHDRAPTDLAKAARFEMARGGKAKADGKKEDSKSKKTGDVQPPSVPINPVAPDKDKVAEKASINIEYAHKHAPGLLADTLYWNPTLWLATGDGEIRFDVGSGQATYRLLLLGHSPTGRFGFHQSRLDVPAVVGR